MVVSPYLIWGTVTDDLGAIQSGATLYLQWDDTEELLSTTTNSLGQYIFDLSNLSTDYTENSYFRIYYSGSVYTTHDMRLKVVSRDIFQVSNMKVKYTT